MFYPKIISLFVISTLFTTGFVWSDTSNDSIQQLESRLKTLFPDLPGPYQIKILSGGFSTASNYIITCENKRFVLRVYGDLREQKDIDREFYAMEKAGLAGISPHIIAVGKDRRSILMDFIEGTPLTPPLSHERANIIQMALTLRLAHAAASNPFMAPNFKTRIEALAKESGLMEGSEALKEALAIFQEELKELDTLNYPKVMIHADVHPHNIFITSRGIQLIDWSETRQDDPFFDLSLFALLQNYNIADEKALIESYLNQECTKEILAHYQRTKRVNLAYLSLTGFWSVTQLKEKETEKKEIDFSKEPNSWGYYVDFFAKREQPITAQFFADFAKAALIYAKKTTLEATETCPSIPLDEMDLDIDIE